jgi:hypothetical protein
MNCRTVRGWLSRYIDGEVPSERRAELEAHIAECPMCAEELRCLRESAALIGGLERQAPPVGSWSAILRQVGSATQQGARSRAWAPAAGLAVAMAAIALLIVVQVWAPRPGQVGGGKPPYRTDIHAVVPGNGDSRADPAAVYVGEVSDSDLVGQTTLPHLGLTEQARDDFAAIEWRRLTGPPPQFLRGLAIDSTAVGNTASVADLSDYARRTRLTLMVIDFNWVTYYWRRTDLSAVNRLAERLRDAGVTVYAMYRPGRLGLKDQPKLPPQINSDGKPDERNICFSDRNARQWVIAWGQQILKNVPLTQGLLLHQPSFSPAACHCPLCTEDFRWRTGKDVGDDETAWLEWRAGVITDFVSEWASEMKRVSPPLTVGVVASAPPASLSMGQDLAALSEVVDILAPVVAINPTGEDDQVDPNLVRATTDLLQSYRERVRLLADLRVYFGDDTRNTTGDIVAAVEGTRVGCDGFFLWGFDPLGSPSRYDQESIAAAIHDMSPAAALGGSRPSPD